MESDMHMQDTHSNEMHDEEHEESPTAVVPKSILMGKDFKVGDEVILKIKSMEGENVELEYAPEPDGEMSEEDMHKMSDKDAEEMPLDKMERKLPKASREY